MHQCEGGATEDPADFWLFMSQVPAVLGNIGLICIFSKVWTMKWKAAGSERFTLKLKQRNSFSAEPTAAKTSRLELCFHDGLRKLKLIFLRFLQSLMPICSFFSLKMCFAHTVSPQTSRISFYYIINYHIPWLVLNPKKVFLLQSCDKLQIHVWQTIMRV